MKNILLVWIIFLSFSFPRRDCLKYAETDALGRIGRPEKETFTISPSGHFFIHYDTTDTDSTSPPNLTDNDENGIPDYIDEVGMIADSAHHVLVEIMGYTEEPFDGEGGYDIFIESFTSGAYGYNTPDSPSLNLDGQTSYLQIDNDYLGFNSNFNLSPSKIMQISVAHEYFHGIQWGYRKNTSGSKYLFEMTSMWFEDILIPDGNDYLDGWADALLNNPTKDFDKMGDGYELALFGYYLSSFVDENGQTDEKNSSIMLEIWKNFKSDLSLSAFYIIQDVLEIQYNMSFSEAWVDFMARNLYNGIYEDMDNDVYYYIDQALIDPIQTTTPTLNDSIRFELDLDNKSVAIQSYTLNGLNTIVEIKHDLNDYIGRVAIVSNELDVNDMFWSRDTILQELYPDNEIHFIYGMDQSSSGTVIIDAIPYTVPIPPSGIVVSAAQDSMILYWNRSPGPGDSLYYIIYRDGDSIFQTIDTNYTDSQGIYGNIFYNYAVTCNNDIGESQPSDIVSIQSWPTENNVTENQILGIYPNPIHKTYDSHILYALRTNYSNTTLELINIKGQIVKRVLLQSYLKGWHRENINNLISPRSVPGIYIIRLRPDNELGRTQKITILP